MQADPSLTSTTRLQNSIVKKDNSAFDFNLVSELVPLHRARRRPCVIQGGEGPHGDNVRVRGGGVQHREGEAPGSTGPAGPPGGVRDPHQAPGEAVQA